MNTKAERAGQVYLSRITASHYGINRRLNSFIRQIKNAEDAVLTASLRRIMLDDLWFYRRTADPQDAPDALRALLGLCETLLEKDRESAERFRLLATVVDFLVILGEAGSDGQQAAALPAAVMTAGLSLLERNLTADSRALIKGSSLVKKLVPLVEQPDAPEARLTRLLGHALEANLAFWENCLDTEPWYRKFSQYLDNEYPGLAGNPVRTALDEARQKLRDARSVRDLSAIDDYSAIRERVVGLLDSFNGAKDRIFFLFFLLGSEGLRESRDYLLWALNNQLRALRALEPPGDREDLEFFLEELFACFDSLKAGHMGPVLACLRAAAEPFYRSGSQKQVDRYLDRVIRFGFVEPSTSGVNRDWEVRTDPNHLKCIRAWLAIIELDPRMSGKLIAALIVNLGTGGVFIADTDLFQKDVSRLLNSTSRASYPLVRQLCRLFPVYYNAIGAEGELRALTTEIDSLSQRQDLLVHFLRKQVHVDSNPTQIVLIEEMLRFYHSGDPEPLSPGLPADVRAGLDPEGVYTAPLRRIVGHLCRFLEQEPAALPGTDAGTIAAGLEKIKDIPDEARRRFLGLLKIHRLLIEKYTLSDRHLIPLLRTLNLMPPDQLQTLERLLAGEDVEPAISLLLKLMRRLKSIILSDMVSEPHETIYYKRHIAAGIPSMYGSYRESKFEALGVLFRVENLLARLMGRLIDKINLSFITAKSLKSTARVLTLFNKALHLNELSSQEFNTNLDMFHYSLTTASFSMEQYINIFQFLAGSVKGIIKEHFLNPFDASLQIIGSRQLQRLKAPTSPAFTRELYKKAEVFYRELLSSSFPLQQLDRFISRVLSSMHTMAETLTPAILQSLMGYDPDVISSSLELATPKTDNRIFLGAKGYYLKKLLRYGFPIPPGFILTTELHRLRGAIRQHPHILGSVYEVIRSRIEELERATGKKLGDPHRPLLLSVRSGAPLSMPGAMSTFLNIGLNDNIAEALSRQRGYAWAAWDCYRRLMQSWGMTFGLPREQFDRIILVFKQRHGVEQKADFSPVQMRELAFAYKQLLDRSGITFEEDPFEQVIQAIIAVNDSWFSSRATVYRRHLKIAEKWGTAVIIQQMVLGNLSRSSGSGVIFTREPGDGGEGVSVYGDFSIRAQGEDVVTGLVHTLPVSEHQNRQLSEPRATTLEKSFPRVYEALRGWAEELIRRRGYSRQEIEFTFESGLAEDLFVLQSRDFAPARADSRAVFTSAGLEADRVGSGMGIGGGAMNGIAVFTQADLEHFSAQEGGQTLILIRPDTVPDTIDMILRCDGLLTARGGITSHAAVTAVNLGKTCVVNCRDLRIDADSRGCSIGSVRFSPGDCIAIDGQSGCIYRGNHQLGEEENLS